MSNTKHSHHLHSQSHPEHCDKHCCSTTTDANLSDAVSISKEEVLGKTTSSVLPIGDPARLCNNERCENLATKNCPRCCCWMYCSTDCQKIDWKSTHKRGCKQFGQTPWRPVSVAEARAGKEFDRPEVLPNKTITNNPMNHVRHLLFRLYFEYNWRIGYFGAARMGKIVFLLKDADDCENFVKMLDSEDFMPPGFTFAEFGAKYHERMSKTERERISDEFMKEESTIRVLAVAPYSDLEIFAPDVEIAVSLIVPESVEHLHHVSQRVAMKAGMRGESIGIYPNWVMANDDGKDPDAAKLGWRPYDWRS